MKYLSFEKIQELITSFSDTDACDALKDALSPHIKKAANGCYYIWNDATALFEEASKDQLVYTLCKYVSDSIKELPQKQRNIIEELDKGRKFTKLSKYDALSSGLNSVFQDKTFAVDGRRDVMNFDNGILCLRTGKFRPRTSTDSYSKCLPFAYSPKVSDKHVKEIEKMLFTVFNCDKTTYEFNMDWLGYCMTGETRLHKLMMYKGTGGNGKSLTMEILMKVFPTYVKKLNKKAFEERSQNKHKYIIDCQAPVRVVFCEELSSDLLDSDAIKDFVCGSINTEVMYSNNISFESHCKLVTTGNRESRFKNDGGMERRVLSISLTNEFLTKQDYDAKKKSGAQNVYLRDDTLKDKFDSLDYKLALIHLLLPRAMKFYTTEFHIPDTVVNESKQLCENNDPMKEFISDELVSTGLEMDKLNKMDFMEAFHNHSKLKQMSWHNILEEAKRCGLKYNKELRYKTVKGCFVGIRFYNHELDAKKEKKITEAVKKPVEQPKQEEAKPVEIKAEVKSESKEEHLDDEDEQVDDADVDFIIDLA